MIIMKSQVLSEQYTKENEAKTVCKTLKNLTGKTAQAILKETGQWNTIPVDLDTILTTLNIRKRATTFESLEESDLNKSLGEISGLVLLKGDDVGIFYKKTDTIHRKRFTIAHELAHCCLHGESMLANGYIEYRSSFTSATDPREIAANTFAGELLIPEHQLKKILSRLIVPSLTALATIFDVSVNVMRARLWDLKVSFFDDSNVSEGDLGDE